MLILDYPDWEKPTLFEAFLPKSLFELTPELVEIDQLLNNPVFEEPIVLRFNTLLGRPTVPVRVFIRMMVLKFYLCISYEDLSVLVSKTPMYKRFCHIPMEMDAPTDTAMMKITKKYGDEIIRELNDNFILELRKKKIIKGRKIRIDSTVIESNIAYPTDAELLYKGVERLETIMTAVKKQQGQSVRKSAKKKTKEMKRKLLTINKMVRRRTNETITEVRNITGTMANMAKETLKQAQSMMKKLVCESKKDQSLKLGLLETIQTVETVVNQTELVNAGGKPENRVVSIIDTDARPISKGKLGKRIEFGHVLQIEEDVKGIVTGYSIHKGNPSDKTLLIDAIHHHVNIFKKAPREIAVDRGYYSKANEDELISLGVKHLSMPKPGKKSKDRQALETTNKFKNLQKFRAGVEARISCLKRSFGMRRSYLRGHKGTSIWCGYGIFAHNLRKAARLLIV
ncbi:MAG: ISNCY family transposase [Nanoarchaeota archaeon]